MKQRILFSLLILFTGLATVLNSCEKREDYSNLIYKNYLVYEIESASEALADAIEGTAEGNYKQGSKQEYQAVIDEVQLVADNSSSTQEEIDRAYADLLDAAEMFYDQMIPYRSVFMQLLDYAKFLQSSTVEGEMEGNVKYGSKDIFQASIDKADQTLAREDLTQRLLDQSSDELSDAIYLFNSSIIGKASIQLTNQGFELPGYETNNFGEVPGWNVFGKAEDWAPKASVALNENAPEGQYTGVIGSYTQGIYQTVYELIQPRAQYTLSANVSLLSNNTDWQGQVYPVIVLTRIIVFEEAEGNYNFLSVLSESYDTLGTYPTGFIELSQTVNIGAGSEYIGKKISVDFIQRHTWNAAEPIWAESYIALDDIRLYREF